MISPKRHTHKNVCHKNVCQKVCSPSSKKRHNNLTLHLPDIVSISLIQNLIDVINLINSKMAHTHLTSEHFWGYSQSRQPTCAFGKKSVVACKYAKHLSPPPPDRCSGILSCINIHTSPHTCTQSCAHKLNMHPHAHNKNKQYC